MKRSHAITPHEDPKAGQLSVLLLAVSAFVIVTTEFVIVGFLPALANDLGVSISIAGMLVTAFAFTVMVLGPFLTALLSSVDRKRLFIGLLLVFAASNALATLASNIYMLGVARIVAALALPVFWGTASEAAAQLAGRERESRAIANVYFGIAAAMVLGIPLGTLGATAFGWRGTFAALAMLSLMMAALLFVAMPRLKTPVRQPFGNQLAILRQPAFLAQMALSALVFTASFTAYTYLADMLERVAQLPPEHVGWWLMGFGVIGLGGNWLGGRLSERDPVWATWLTLVGLAIGTAVFVPMAAALPGLCFSLLVWGIANTAFYPICQVRMMRAAPGAEALAGTLNVSMAQAGIGLGAVVGGAVISKAGIHSVGYAAGVISVVAILLALALNRANTSKQALA